MEPSNLDFTKQPFKFMGRLKKKMCGRSSELGLKVQIEADAGQEITQTMRF